MVKCCGIGMDFQEARVSQNMIGDVYNKIAPFYNIWGKATESKARNRALELAQIKDGQTVLEVAVGTGLAFYEVAKRNPNGLNIGIDLSEGMLAKAKKRMEKLKTSNYILKTGTAFKLDLENESVDVLINNYMFDLITFDEMDQIIDEFKRVLKTNGKLILVNMTIGERFGSNIYELIYKTFPMAMGGCRGVKLTEKLKVHGFDIKVREYHQQLLFPSEVIFSLKSDEIMVMPHGENDMF